MTLTDFKVADLSLAPMGRKQIDLAEHEMPWLMAIRATTAAPGGDGLTVGHRQDARST